MPSQAPSRVTISLPERHDGQKQVVSEAGRFSVLNCGRRWGKDTLGVDLAVETALEGQPVGWFAPTYKSLTEDWRAVNTALAPIIQRRSEQEHRLDLYGGGVVDMWSLDAPDTIRGRRYKRVIVNEAAQVSGLQYAWQYVLRPCLVDLVGDAWLMSTPRPGYWQTLVLRGEDPLEPDWRSWTYPTSANPHIPAEEIEAARRELPESVFAQEFLAAFVAGEGAVFRNVLACATGGGAAPQDGHRYIIGADWGKSADFSVFTIIDCMTKEVVRQDRSNRVDYAVQMGRLEGLSRLYGKAVVVAERNSMGEPIIEQVWRRGMTVMPWTASNASKAVVIEQLALAFEKREIVILKDPVLVGELQAYEATRLPSGMTRYAAPEGMHDDCVMALAMAWAGVRVPVRGRAKLSEFRYADG